jgi:hypothetical protein
MPLVVDELYSTQLCPDDDMICVMSVCSFGLSPRGSSFDFLWKTVHQSVMEVDCLVLKVYLKTCQIGTSAFVKPAAGLKGYCIEGLAPSNRM